VLGVNAMKKRITFIKAIPYALAFAVMVVGIFIALIISHYAIPTRGILGLAVCYYSARYFLFPLRRVGGFGNFNFPTGIGEVISVLFFTIVLSLAILQLANVALWLIHLF
jgi:hypothetical protein